MRRNMVLYAAGIALAACGCCAIVAAFGGCSAAPDGLMREGLALHSARTADSPLPCRELAMAPARSSGADTMDDHGLARSVASQVRSDSPGPDAFWFVLSARDLEVAMADPLEVADGPGGGAPQIVPRGTGAAAAAMGTAAADDGNRSASRPAGEPARIVSGDGMSYLPWRQRQGPAYPGNFWYSFGRWGKEMPETLWDDTKATFTNGWTLAGLAAAGVTGIAMSSTSADNKVADYYTRHGHQLNSFWDSVGDAGGNPGTHFAVAGAMYLTSLAKMDKVNYEKACTLMNALIINDLTVLALKGLVHTRSPNGDPWGWPSGHTSSSFTLATVMYEEYGPWVGVPLFAFAGFVGYERIDARNHDFSDVISGALIGMAIGHAVAQNHMPRVLGFDIVPIVQPSSGTVGVAATKRW